MMKYGVVFLAMVLVSGLVLDGAVTAQDEGTSDANQATTETQAYLGLGVGPLSPALASQLPDVIGKGRGVLVLQVAEGSPADQAGLKQYDVLVRYNDQDLYSPEQLVKLVRNAEPGSEVEIGYVRGGKLQEAKITLTETPARGPVRGHRWMPWMHWFHHPQQGSQARQQGSQSRQQGSQSRGQALSRSKQRRTPWNTFESMTIAKQGDDTYKVDITYRDANKKKIHHEYVGTREEIKNAIKADKDLPVNERQHLLRSLDKEEQQEHVSPWQEDWERELFNWPNLGF